MEKEHRRKRKKRERMKEEGFYNRILYNCV
jgi:hypothetical protein